MRLEIWSDPACPWCYLGYGRLKAAVKAAGTNPFDIHWKPFQLEPDLPKTGRDRSEYLVAKYGNRAGVDAMHARITAMGRETGISYNFATSHRVVNSFDAHRLLFWAGQEGRADKVAEGLFAANFTHGRDISDPAVLEEIAVAAGMQPGLAARLLASGANAAEVAAEEARGRAMGISGVPLFLLDGKYAISGAQDESTWAGVIADVMAASA